MLYINNSQIQFILKSSKYTEHTHNANIFFRRFMHQMDAWGCTDKEEEKWEKQKTCRSSTKNRGQMQCILNQIDDYFS